MKVQTGHTVSVHYVGTLSDGTEFDNSRTRGQTLDFELGSGQLLEAFNNGIVGMSVGETKTISIACEDAYGRTRPEAIQKVPRAAFADDFEFIIGNSVQGSGPAGQFIAKITAVEEEFVVLDLNHPLAGQDLTFEVELVSATEGTATEEVTMANWSPSMKKAELLQIAKSRGLPVTTKFTKAQIIEALTQ